MDMNNDSILHCLLNHKAIQTKDELKMLSQLTAHNIGSGNEEKSYCLKKGFFIHRVLTFENNLGGHNSMAQISVSHSGETEIKRLWAYSSLNPIVKNRKRFLWVLSKIILPLLFLLLSAYLGYIFGRQ